MSRTRSKKRRPKVWWICFTSKHGHPCEFQISVANNGNVCRAHEAPEILGMRFRDAVEWLEDAYGEAMAVTRD